MGMSTHVVAIKPPDEKWEKMKAVFDACQAAGTEVPDEVWEFFDHETPDDAGVITSMGSGYGELHECVTRYSDDSRQGFEIEVAKLPKDVKILRFYNSW
jgi:hypothetical protein